MIIEMRGAATPPAQLLYAGNVPELQSLSLDAERLTLGAGVTMSRLHRALAGQADLAALKEAAQGLGSEQIRNRATVGGNVAKALPSGDLLPVLRLLGANARIIGPEGDRELPVGELLLGPGRTALAPNEALATFTIPRPGPGVFTAFAKVGSRRAVTIARLGLALSLALEGSRILKASVILGAVAETPVPAPTVEAALAGHDLNTRTLDEAGRALSSYILEINHRPNREYKAWAAPGALADACRSIKAAAGL
jgi:carbon-monoxide dehydrogenase medium subunit